MTPAAYWLAGALAYAVLQGLASLADQPDRARARRRHVNGAGLLALALFTLARSQHAL